MNPEKPSTSQERGNDNLEAKQAAAEQEKRIGEQLDERAKELEQAQSPEKGAEKARDDALNEAVERREAVTAEIVKERDQSPAERRKDGPISKAKREESFKATMNEVQQQMSTPSRTFSKVIHSKAVEKTSEVAGDTVARPNALLSGAVFAFVLTLAVYIVAKNIGYPLSGFESIGAFILGWLIGILYDFLKVMITGRK